MQGATTRRSGATARSRNTAGEPFAGLPEGFERVCQKDHNQAL